MRFIIPFSLFLLGILVTGSLPGAMAKTCPEGWLQAQADCYAYFDDKLTWDDAEVECQSYGPGTHLASILNSAEGNIVAKYISTYQKQKGSVWIGLHDVYENRRWKWSDGSLYNYKAWGVNQPDNYGGIEYCVELLLSTGGTRPPCFEHDNEERKAVQNHLDNLRF